MGNIDKYVRGRMLNDGSHEYAIPESLYNEHNDYIENFDEYRYEDCQKWDSLFGHYRVEGNFEFYIKLKQ